MKSLLSHISHIACTLLTICDVFTPHPNVGAAPGKALLFDGDEPRGRHGGRQAGARRGAGGQDGARAAAQQDEQPVTERIGLVRVSAKFAQPDSHEEAKCNLDSNSITKERRRLGCPLRH